MTMQIADKLETLRVNAAADPNLAVRVAVAGRAAIFAGMHKPDGGVTPEWERLMEFVTNVPKELERLCGQDTVFNESEWGLYCLAYIAGDVTCTSETPGTTGPKRTMTMPELAARNMLEVLDREETDEE